MVYAVAYVLVRGTLPMLVKCALQLCIQGKLQTLCMALPKMRAKFACKKPKRCNCKCHADIPYGIAPGSSMAFCRQQSQLLNSFCGYPSTMSSSVYSCCG